MLQLIESHCVPLLTYAIEVIVANRDERRQLRVAYNSVFRKIFGYRWSQSVSALQSFLGRPTWEQLVENRQASFTARINRTGGDSLARALLTRTIYLLCLLNFPLLCVNTTFHYQYTYANTTNKSRRLSPALLY